MSISWPPIASISSRTICTAFWCTRQPAGIHDHRPEPTWRMSPARTMSLCESASASAGGWRSVGRKYSDRRVTARTLVSTARRVDVAGKVCSPHRGEERWLTRSRRFRTTTTRSSRTSTSRRCGCTTTSTIRPTWTRSTPRWRAPTSTDKPIEEVIANLDAVPEDKRGAVRNNGGGHLNHTAVLGDDEPRRRRRPGRRPRERDRRRLRLVRRLQGEVRGRRRRPVRLGLGVARRRRRQRWRSPARRTRTTRSATARRRCWATTSGSTPTTSSTRTSARTTSRRGGTPSTGRRSPSASRAAK